jgi:hypothetical protein
MRALFASCALVLVCHCGGKDGSSSNPPDPPDAATADGGTDSGIACYGSGHGPPSSSPADSRPSATTCPRTPIPGAPLDAGPLISCNTDADCAVDAANTGPNCVEHACGYDRCLADSDCASNELCVCGAMAGGGNTIHVSQCVPAGCHTDADCGAGNYCVASRGTCGAVAGYNCTSSRDTCIDPATDCASCHGNGCVYTPVVGHFVCATSGCNG